MDAGFARFCAALGEQVRTLRRDRAMTQEDMIDHGFTVRHYQRIEAGRSITLVTIWKLARALGVPPRSILPAGFSPAASGPAEGTRRRTGRRRHRG
jgi:transcriptional regulator with XRE-family HTH domain